MPVPQEGKAASAFSGVAHTGEKVALKDFKGEKNVVLYFYPKDDTPGCTKEACSFRDNKKMFDKADTVIIGVSRDSVASHNKFIAKYDLPFLLISDEDETICRKYDVIKERNMYGKKVMGIMRSTFVIGKDGKIKKIFHNVKVDGHTEKVLNLLKD